MNKSTTLKLIILSTIFSLVMILMSYFGIIRYVTLHFNKAENYIQTYQSLPKASDKRVIISLTTTPNNINKLTPIINSLLDQTVKVDMIALNLPPDVSYNIPPYLEKVVNIFRTGKDYGNGTKLIPTLFREKECNTIIIAISDNQIYGKDFIETLITESDKTPDTIIRDTKNTAMLVKPSFFGCGVINREQDTFNDDWFLHHSKGGRLISYGENYTCFRN